MERPVLLGGIQPDWRLALSAVTHYLEKVSNGPATRQRWLLTREALDALLLRLSPDRDEAARQFELLRRKLLQFFTYEACRFPDRWADETLDRLAKRLVEGEPVDDVNGFVRGASRLVLKEAQLIEQRDRAAAAAAVPLMAEPTRAESDARCLERCLAQLPAEQRSLVEAYYTGDMQARISGRKELAARFGMTVEALRSRAFRIRRQLEDCFFQCRDMPSPKSSPKGKGSRPEIGHSSDDAQLS